MLPDTATSRDEAEAIAREDAAALAQKRWDKASTHVDLGHPYLMSKGVTSTEGIRQEGEVLLIPMKAIEDKRIVSLQQIFPNGDKLYLKHARTARTRTTIGFKHLILDGDKKPAPGQRIYVAEGWATAWTISHVMQAPVVVAFSTGNLAAICKYLVEEYVRPHQLELVLAADNDRWTGQAGVTVARKAIYPPFGYVAIPDFQPENLALKPGETKGPTDFNDLWMLEGPEAVRHWLEPEHARDATITKDERPDLEPQHEPEPDAPPVDVAPWYERAHFRCLGYDDGTFFYLPREGGQIVALTAQGHDRKQLMQLAPLSWWAEAFPSRREGVDWAGATDALMRQSYKAGVFTYGQLRGRGCWPDEEGVILHLGDRLLPPKKKAFVDPETFSCSRKLVYERKTSLPGPSSERALTLEEAQHILGIFQDIQWLEEASAYLLAGWVVLAPVCGALKWRPHVFLIGSVGAGKTTIVRDVIVPLLGGLGQYFEGGTTEPGIRQKLRADALPVVYDEAEAVDIRSDGRIQAILGLARSASSTGAETAKGTTYGRAMSFQTRSMFCLAAVGGAVRQEADKSRISLLQLRSPHDTGAEVRRKHWETWAPKVKALTEEKHGRELFARTLRWLRSGDLHKTIATFQAQATALLGNARAGDQYGTLYAGAWTLMSDEPPTVEMARATLEAGCLGQYIAEQAPEGIRVIDLLLQQRDRVDTSHGTLTVTVGECVEVCRGRGQVIGHEAAIAYLKRIGIRYEIEDGNPVLWIATSGDWISKILRDTPYASNVSSAFRTIRGVRAKGPTNFGGFYSRAAVVPLVALDDWWAAEQRGYTNGSAPKPEGSEAEVPEGQLL